MARMLNESLSYDEARIVMEYADQDSANPSKPREMFMKGIFIQGGVKNLNERVYPLHEIRKAVEDIRASIQRGFQVLGELDHPDELNINLPNVSHVITDMWMDGSNGMGKLQILPTPMGQIARTILEHGVKLGVSSRGSGNVNEDGSVSDFQIVTVDIVARPSAPEAYPVPVSEALRNHKRGVIIEDIASAVKHDPKAQKFLKEEVLKFVNSLKL